MPLRRCAGMLLCILTLLGALLLPAAADAPEMPDLSAVSTVLLYNIDSGTLMFEQNADRQIFPAATVKLMVALVAYERLHDRLDETVTVDKSVINESSGVKLPLRAGERIAIRHLFYGLIVSGANDCAMALALECSGSLDGFLGLMNAKAREMGMTSTYYVNVSGIDHFTQQTSGRDLLRLCLAAYETEFIRETAALVTVELPATNMRQARTIYTRNYLLSRYTYPYYVMEEATGLSYGETQMAGNCTCATAVIGNVRYLCIVMGGISEESEWNGEKVKVFRSLTVARDLLRWGSKAFEYRAVISPQLVYGELPVELANGSDYVTVVPRETLEIFIHRDADTSTSVTVIPTLSVDHLTAPVEEGQIVGEIEVRDLSGELLDRTELMTKNALSLSRFKYWLAELRHLTETKVFRICAILLLLGLVIGVLVTARVRYLRQARLALRRQSR